MHWIDPAQLPLIKGTIERFTVNGQGELDGLILDTGASIIKLVHFPSHMAHDVGAVLKQGDEVGVRGLKPRDADVIAAVALECANGVEIIDRGPTNDLARRISAFKQLPMSAEGKIRLTLFTPKGKVRGVLLEDGTILRMTLKLAEQIKERLRPGASVEVHGTGCETPHGRVIEVHQMATPSGKFDVVRKSSGFRSGAAESIARDQPMRGKVGNEL
jgi:hypothetical protein